MKKWRVVLNNFEFNEKNVWSIFFKRFLINNSTFFISWNSRNERELYELFPLIQSALKERRIRITPVFYIERPGVWIRGCREKNHSVDEVSVFFCLNAVLHMLQIMNRLDLIISASLVLSGSNFLGALFLTYQYTMQAMYWLHAGWMLIYLFSVTCDTTNKCNGICNLCKMWKRMVSHILSD